MLSLKQIQRQGKLKYLDILQHEKHIGELYDIFCKAEKYLRYDYLTFYSLMSKRQGFVIYDDSKVIGCISFSEYVPANDINIHVFVAPEYHGKWAIKRQWYYTIFAYPFEYLNLPRVSAYIIRPFYRNVEELLHFLGFKLEGVLRKKEKWVDGTYRDVAVYGLLKEEQWRR